MLFKAIPILSVTFILSGGICLAQSGGGGSGGGSGSSGSANSSSASSAATTGGSTSSPAGAPTANGTTSSPTLSNALQGSPGTPNTQPNTYGALNQGSSGNQMGTIGGSNGAGPGSAAPGSAVDSLSSTSTGVLAPSSNSSVQPGAR